MAGKRNSKDYGDYSYIKSHDKYRYDDDYDEYDEYDDEYYDEYDDEPDEYDEGYDDYEDEEGETYSRQVKMSGKSVKKQKRKKLIELWFFFIVFAVVICVAYVEISKRLYRGEPISADLVGDIIHLDADYSIADVINDNHERYMKKAYVYVEGQYQKISANVERNAFEDIATEFSVPDGKKYVHYTGEKEISDGTVIDVSSYNKDVNWAAVKESGVEGVMIRTGYRGYGEDANIVADQYFTSNFAGARDAGLNVGVYFFTQAVTYEEGVEEAKYVLSQIGGAELSMPIAIDTEYVDADESARANNIDNTARTDAIVGFCETIKEAGYTPMIYANRNWFLTRFEIDRIGKYQFWLANYSLLDFPYHIEGMQYTPEGNVSGVSGNCDVNVWFHE